MEEGIYLRIPIGEATLREAVGMVEDPAFWVDTMPLILFHFSIRDYWELTVVEHRLFYDFLVARGLAEVV